MGELELDILQTHITGNDLLMDYASMFALRVAPTAGEIFEDSAWIKEAADTFNFWCFRVEHCAV